MYVKVNGYEGLEAKSGSPSGLDSDSDPDFDLERVWTAGGQLAGGSVTEPGRYARNEDITSTTA